MADQCQSWITASNQTKAQINFSCRSMSAPDLGEIMSTKRFDYCIKNKKCRIVLMNQSVILWCLIHWILKILSKYTLVWPRYGLHRLYKDKTRFLTSDLLSCVTVYINHRWSLIHVITPEAHLSRCLLSVYLRFFHIDSDLCFQFFPVQQVMLIVTQWI